jgi:hypothetical protein
MWAGQQKLPRAFLLETRNHLWAISWERPRSARLRMGISAQTREEMRSAIYRMTEWKIAFGS